MHHGYEARYQRIVSTLRTKTANVLITPNTAWFIGNSRIDQSQLLCPVFDDLKSTYASESIGLGISLLGVARVNIDAGVQSIVTYATTPPDSLPSLDPQGNVVMAVIQHQASLSVFDVYLRPSITFDLPLGITAECGLRVLFNVDNNLVQVLRILEPSTVTFYVENSGPNVYFDNNRAMMTGSGPLTSTPKTRLDIDASVGKSFIIDDFTIQVLLLYQMGLSDISIGVPSRGYALAGTIGLLYRL